jgi:Putative metallopeptidase
MAIGSRSGGRATARQMSFADLELLRQGVRLDERISKPPPLRNTKTLQYRFLLFRTAALQTRSDLILTFGLNVRASCFVPQCLGAGICATRHASESCPRERSSGQPGGRAAPPSQMREMLVDSVARVTGNGKDCAALTRSPWHWSTFMAPRAYWKGYLPLFLFFLMSGAAPAQQPPAHLSPPPQSQTPPGKLQERLDETVHALRENNPRYKDLSPQYVQGLVEFVSGNMLFVVLHEMAHVAITQMGLPVLGRAEDAADSYAALRLIRSGTDFSHRVLIEAAEGWFMADRRDQKMGDKVAYYDEHGLNQQRAYQIVCLMVGSDDEKFKDLARQTNLPDERRDGCTGDYSNAAYSWDLVLKPHRRAPDQPKTNIDVIYGSAEDRVTTARQVARSIRLLETVAEHAADEYVWPAPFTLEMQSCGFPNAHWDLPTHTLTVCYELALEFADLYRTYADVRADGSAMADSSKPKTINASAFKPNRQKIHRKPRRQ